MGLPSLGAVPRCRLEPGARLVESVLSLAHHHGVSLGLVCGGSYAALLREPVHLRAELVAGLSIP